MLKLPSTMVHTSLKQIRKKIRIKESTTEAFSESRARQNAPEAWSRNGSKWEIGEAEGEEEEGFEGSDYGRRGNIVFTRELGETGEEVVAISTFK